MSMSHCPTASLPAAPVAATYDTSKYLHNPASLAPLSAAFPRNSWSEGAVFGLPPYHSGEHAYQLCWAAREASKCWERVLSREHADSGDLSSSIQASDVVDATCFKLAVVDKALEVNAFLGRKRANVIRPPTLKYADWLTDTDTMLEAVYHLACDQLPCGTAAPEYHTIQSFLRSALNVWCQQAVRVTNVPPRNNKEPFAIDDLGRFAAKYYEHRHRVLREDVNDRTKFSSTVVVYPAETYTPAAAPQLVPSSTAEVSLSPSRRLVPLVSSQTS